MNIDKNLTAPITKGEDHGKLVVKLGDDLIAEMPLVALENVQKGTMWSRFSDYVSLGVQRMLTSQEEPAQNS
jgi:D-alanyl-D-alanine carboxypeptidase (penicillin-binding protein 5/6)